MPAGAPVFISVPESQAKSVKRLSGKSERERKKEIILSITDSKVYVSRLKCTITAVSGIQRTIKVESMGRAQVPFNTRSEMNLHLKLMQTERSHFKLRFLGLGSSMPRSYACPTPRLLPSQAHPNRLSSSEHPKSRY